MFQEEIEVAQKQKEFQNTIERCAEFLKTGFFVLVYDLSQKDLSDASSAGLADPIFVEEASAKLGEFLKNKNWKNFDQGCRGVLRCGHKVWVVAGEKTEKNEAICAYLALRFTKVGSGQEWIDLVRSARKIKDFVLLNEAFVKSDQETVLYRKGI